MKWIKGNERLPDLTQHSESELHFRFDGKKVCGVQFMSDGFEVKILSIYTGYYNDQLHRLEWLDESQHPAEQGKTDMQISWELSQTKDKPFFIDIVRRLVRDYDDEEISLSKLVEELNLMAYKWAQSQPEGSEPTAGEQDDEYFRDHAKEADDLKENNIR